MIETELAQIISLLVDVQGLTLKPDHKDYIRKLIKEHPTVDVREVIEKWAASTIDVPLKKGCRVCGQWLTWVKNAERWGQDRRKVSGAVVEQERQQDSKFRLIHWGAR